MSKSPFDVKHPMFRPFWRRALVTALVLGWAVFEWSGGNQLWALVFGVAGGYLFLQFFVQFDPADYEKSEED